MKLSDEAIKSAGALEELLNETVFKTRRSFIKKGAIAALAASMPMTGLMNRPAIAGGSGGRIQTDVETLSTASIIELKAVNTYRAAAALTDEFGDPLISDAYLSVALAFIEDHEQHAAVFNNVIRDLGGEEPAAPDPADTLIPDFPPGPNSQLDATVGVLRYALALEVVAAKLWFDNFKSVEDLAAKRAFADIAPNEAAHAAIFRAALKFIESQPTDHDNADAGKAVVPFSLLSLDSAVF